MIINLKKLVFYIGIVIGKDINLYLFLNKT